MCKRTERVSASIRDVHSGDSCYRQYHIACRSVLRSLHPPFRLLFRQFLSPFLPRCDHSSPWPFPPARPVFRHRFIIFHLIVFAELLCQKKTTGSITMKRTGPERPPRSLAPAPRRNRSVLERGFENRDGRINPRGIRTLFGVSVIRENSRPFPRGQRRCIIQRVNGRYLCPCKTPRIP